MKEVIHPIDPVFDSSSRILILGSFPSVKSRESMFYYGHPQNRFWKLLSLIYEEEVPSGNKEKKEFLLKHHIALWDVIHSCTIKGSSDASIENVKANDIAKILDCAGIEEIYVNGKTAGRLYNQYIYKKTGRKCIVLPSTSSANASKSFDSLYEDWKVIRFK